MNTAFSHALRVVVCRECGAAMHVPLEGGAVACSLCSSPNEVGPRDDRQLGAGLSQRPEAERLAALAAQIERHEDEVPEAIRAALPMVARDGAADAVMSAWQAARRELSLLDAPEAEDRLFWLTLHLHHHTTGRGDDVQLRALLETALEALPSPAYRQVVYCLLAREAAAGSDLAAAEEWLAPCDGRAYDVRADSAYRLASALLEIRRRHPERALALLGLTPGDVPVARSARILAAGLRTVAFAELERHDDAAEALRSAGRGVSDVNAVESALAQCGLRLPPAILATARGDAAPAAVRPARSEWRARLGRRASQIIPLGLLTLFFLALAAATDARATAVGGQRLDILFLVLGISFALPLLLILYRARKR
jgi:hypothetical protein